MAVDAAGLTLPTLEETLAAVEADQRSEIDPTVVTEPEEPLGEINGILVSRLREVYELAQTAYHAFNPDAVEGYLQDALCGITGTFRLRATKSEVDVECDLEDNTVLPGGAATLHVVSRPLDRFTLIDDLVSTTAGLYTGRFRAEEYGPVVANTDTLTVIATPITGWNSATNNADTATAPNKLGRDEETPEALRLRREEELFRPGSSTTQGIAADVLALDGIEQCTVLENLTFTTDVNGIPALSVETIVFDGLTPAVANDDIAQAIWDSKAAGVRSYGSTSGTATADNGEEHTVYFSRAAILDLYLEFDITTDPDEYPGPATFKATVESVGQTYLNVDSDVIAERLKAVALSVPGVLDVPELRLGFSAAPAGVVNLTVGVREIADIDTANITVTVL